MKKLFALLVVCMLSFGCVTTSQTPSQDLYVYIVTIDGGAAVVYIPKGYLNKENEGIFFLEEDEYLKRLKEKIKKQNEI